MGERGIARVRVCGVSLAFRCGEVGQGQEQRHWLLCLWLFISHVPNLSGLNYWPKFKGLCHVCCLFGDFPQMNEGRGACMHMCNIYIYMRRKRNEGQRHNSIIRSIACQ